MKSLFTAMIFGIILAGVSFAQGPAKRAAGTSIAVVEFTPSAAAGMSAEAKRQLQASIAFELSHKKKFEVPDVRNTRAASQSTLAAVNGDASTAAAVKVGKQMGAAYVLTGVVAEYDTKGSATLKVRLVEVATGKVKYSGEIKQQSTSPMRGTGDAEMKTKVLKPAIEKLADAIAAGL